MRIESIIKSPEELKLLEDAGIEGDKRKLPDEIRVKRRIAEERRRREEEERLREEAKRLREEEQREWEEVLASVRGNLEQAKLIWQLRRGGKLNIRHFDKGTVREVSQRAAKRPG